MNAPVRPTVRERVRTAVVRRTRLQEVLDERVRRELWARGVLPYARRFEYVFVVTPGRAGSTLVQGLLNELPETLIRGENDFYLHGLYEVWRNVRRFQELHTTNRHRQPVSAFYGLMGIKRTYFTRAMRNIFVMSALGEEDPDQIRRLGFKEVLWHRIAPEDTAEFFALLDRAFPEVRYVLNRRDPEVTAGSGFWRGQERADALAAIHRVLEIQQFLRETYPDRVVDVEYERLTSDDDAVRRAQLEELVTFVTREPVTPELMGTLLDAMKIGHGPAAFGQSRDDGLGAVAPEGSPQAAAGE